ncbi:MAG: PD-(D/E)XK nuclease domain-containing protein, partial [Desulfamplus sp.]|nr:PD-(D/E)XK nuclease domain-containing protein [Desulfamplus sp.]
FEFKVDGKGAMEQLKGMGYHEKYMADSKAITLIAMEFSSQERNIVHLGWEKIK